MTLVETSRAADTLQQPVQQQQVQQRLQQRLIDAAVRCVGRWGVTKTTLDDVAREAGCSRATVYRAFPGGKDAVLDAVVAAEISRFFAGLAARVDGVDELEDLLVATISYSANQLASHDALQFVLAYEPEVILPRTAFRHMDEVLAKASAFGAPYLERWVGAAEAARATEWVARIVISYALCPGDDVDLGDEESVRRLVRTFVLPGLRT